MTMATMTLIGLYNFRPDLFDLMTLPSGIDKNTLVEDILMKSGEFEVLYSDPDFVHDSIRMWSAKWYHTFERWVKALNTSYDPLTNYDRNEEWTDENNGVGTVKGTTTDQSSASVDNKISAYNSSTMQPDTSSKSTGSGSSTLDNTNTTQNKNVRKGRAWGNIGVTTSQQMLREELSVAEWNLYDHIADVFLQEYVIPVY